MRARIFQRTLVMGICLLGSGLSAAPGLAQGCGGATCEFNSCRSPAVAVPQALWGTLRPTDTGQLPNVRDSTNFHDIIHFPSLQYAHWMSLDIANGWIFAAVDLGLEIWDARAQPANPQRRIQVGEGGFPTWPTEEHEGAPVRDVALAAGHDASVVVGLGFLGGLAIFDSSNKASPRAVYADRDKSVLGVYAAEIGGRRYAFGAGQGFGLMAYDLEAAEGLATVCHDSTPQLADCGVYLGRVGTSQLPKYLDGVASADGSRHFLAVAPTVGRLGFELWDVSVPQAPIRKLSALSSSYVHGVALWRQGSSYFVALRWDSGVGGQPTVAAVYDVSCALVGQCGSLGAPLWSRTMPQTGDDYYVTHSERAGRPYVYFAAFDWCNRLEPIQNEWLYDMSNPRSPVDLTPPAQVIDGVLTGYWGWYYRGSPTGFNYVGPRMGRFYGDYFYRAAYSIFDIHQIVDTSLLFADGFESGDLSAWTSTLP